MTLQEQISYDIETRISSRDFLPFRLTLDQIARHYGVSLMPVRQAVDELVKRKVLVRQDNGRLDRNERSRSKRRRIRTKQPPAAEPLIVKRIVAMSLAGSSEFIREETTADEFNIGRTVLRRILTTLAGSGLLIHEPRRGWRVRPFREKELHDYIQVRLLLEPRALELAYQNLDRSTLEKLLVANQPSQGRPRLDNSLHRLWVDHCDNAYIQQFFAGHGGYHMALLEHAAFETAAIERMATEHCAILKALLDNDLPTAIDHLKSHILSQTPNLSRLLGRAILK